MKCNITILEVTVLHCASALLLCCLALRFKIQLASAAKHTIWLYTYFWLRWYRVPNRDAIKLYLFAWLNKRREIKAIRQHCAYTLLAIVQFPFIVDFALFFIAKPVSESSKAAAINPFSQVTKVIINVDPQCPVWPPPPLYC